MNLFLNPSITELQKLIDATDNSKKEHNIVVDYDGEVLIDPELQNPHINLDRFKFRINLYEVPKDYINRGSKWMKKLLNRLVDGWENNINNFGGGNSPAFN